MTSSAYLTQADFKAARSCHTKLYYRQLGYATTPEHNQAESLSTEQGRLMIALAQRRYPDGRWLSDGPVEPQSQATVAALHSAESVTLFNATLLSEGKLACIDILVKQGSTLRLLAVRWQHVDDRNSDNLFWKSNGVAEIRSAWRPHLEDIAFQLLVLQACYPNATIIPALIVPDSTQTSSLDRPQNLPWRANGRPVNSTVSDDLLFLREIDVSHEVAALLPDVATQAAFLLAGLTPDLWRLPAPLTTRCRECEYRLSNGAPSGFRECWGDMADSRPHILDLYSVGTVGDSGDAVVNGLIAERKTTLYDIPLEALGGIDGVNGPQAARQRVQIQQTCLDAEWRDPALADLLAAVPYPLHFVDFETCTPAVPRYAGLRPAEIVAFQWSCHTIAAPGQDATHSEWLQGDDEYPNLAFVRTLRRHLGDDGTIVVWSGHERTVLRAIQHQAAERRAAAGDLSDWIDRAVAQRPKGRMLDLYRLASRYYYHPSMAGKTTVKSVCEAVWRQSAALRARYPSYGGDHPAVQSPYQALPRPIINGEEVTVRNGTGAILAYGHMMGDHSQDTEANRQTWRELLQAYCQLDTLAMVMIWQHWLSDEASVRA